MEITCRGLQNKAAAVYLTLTDLADFVGCSALLSPQGADALGATASRRAGPSESLQSHALLRHSESVADAQCAALCRHLAAAQHRHLSTLVG